MSEPVDLGPREGEVAAAADAVLQPDDAEPGERTPEVLVHVHHLGREVGGDGVALAVHHLELAVDHHLLLGEPPERRLGVTVEGRSLFGGLGELGVERVGVLHQLDDLVLDAPPPPLQGVDLLLHRLQLTR